MIGLGNIKHDAAHVRIWFNGRSNRGKRLRRADRTIWLLRRGPGWKRQLGNPTEHFAINQTLRIRRLPHADRWSGTSKRLRLAERVGVASGGLPLLLLHARL